MRTFATAGAALTVLVLVVTIALDVQLHDLGRGDLTQLDGPAVPFIVAALATVLVGLALSLRLEHPVGPLFVGLGLAMSLSGLLDGYDRLSLLVDPPAYRGSRWVLSLDEASFVPWMLLICTVLLVTPSGRLPGPRWRTFVRAAVVAGLTLVVVRSFVPGTFEPPYDHLHHPFELHTGGVLEVLRAVCGIFVSVAPVVAAVSLVRRFRASTGDERQQLRWVGYGAAMTGVGLSLTAAAVLAGLGGAVTLLAGLSLAVLPVTTGIAVSRYRLYDLDRLVSRTVTYAIVSALLVATWAAGVLAVSRAVSSRIDAALPASAATLATAAAAVPLLRGVREAVDRRFRRRRFDALRTISTYVSRPAGETASTAVEQVLREALQDEDLRVAFWLPDHSTYVDAVGATATPADAALVLTRDGTQIAAVTSTADPALLAEACQVALPELEAAQLRAALQSRITELSQSRARLASVAQDERRRLERDLHDGAQQRLLAVLFALESAQRRTTGDARPLLAEAVEQTRVALSELRDLAHGLRPTASHGDGLREALEGLVGGCPTPTALEVTGSLAQLDEDLEAAAYYVVAEALSNATKHADARSVRVLIDRCPDRLQVVVRDDGRGGADANGTGLRGLADRAEVAGGTLTVRDLVGGGTEVHVELPCGS